MASYHVHFGATWAQLVVLIMGSNFIAARLLLVCPHYNGLKKKHPQAHATNGSPRKTKVNFSAWGLILPERLGNHKGMSRHPGTDASEEQLIPDSSRPAQCPSSCNSAAALPGDASDTHSSCGPLPDALE